MSFEAMLKELPFVVLDGAFGTEAARRGYDTVDELWAARALYERPDLVTAIHRDYYAAGADVCTSASYQASVDGFMKKGFTAPEARALIARSVELVKRARAEAMEMPCARGRAPMLAAASIGPYGAYLADGSEYTGNYTLTEAELRDFHAERMAILAAACPDVFACETLPLLTEARAIVAELARFPDIPAWVSFSCRNASETCGGDSIAECARWLDAVPQVTAIGINCTAPQFVADLVRTIRTVTAKPIAVYPNTGEEYIPISKTWRGCGIAFHDFAREWYDAGARLIGGCCRTSPQDIAAVAALRESLR